MLSKSLVFSQASPHNSFGTASLRQMADDKERNIFCGKYFFIKVLVALNANLSRRSSKETQAAT